MTPEGSLPHSQQTATGPILSQLNPGHTLTPISLRSILIGLLPPHPPSGVPSGLPPSSSHAFSYPMHATFPAHLIFRDFMTLIA